MSLMAALPQEQECMSDIVAIAKDGLPYAFTLTYQFWNNFPAVASVPSCLLFGSSTLSTSRSVLKSSHEVIARDKNNTTNRNNISESLNKIYKR